MNEFLFNLAVKYSESDEKSERQLGRTLLSAFVANKGCEVHDVCREVTQGLERACKEFERERTEYRLRQNPPG